MANHRYKNVPYHQITTVKVVARCTGCDQSWTGYRARYRGLNHARQRGADHVVLTMITEVRRQWRTEPGEVPVRERIVVEDGSDVRL